MSIVGRRDTRNLLYPACSNILRCQSKYLLFNIVARVPSGTESPMKGTTISPGTPANHIKTSHIKKSGSQRDHFQHREAEFSTIHISIATSTSIPPSRYHCHAIPLIPETCKNRSPTLYMASPELTAKCCTQLFVGTW